MKYYLLRDDIDFPKRWYLGDIQHIDNWGFSDPTVEFMEPCTYTMSIYQEGCPMDYTVSETYAVPILSKKAKDSLCGLPEVDKPYYHVVLEPVIFDGKSALQGYSVMIIETQLDCVDEIKSDFKKYEVDDPVRPDRVGEYRVFSNLVIDPSKTDGHHIFRIKKHLNSIIVSEEVKNRFEKAGVEGAIFESVNGDCQTVS